MLFLALLSPAFAQSAPNIVVMTDKSCSMGFSSAAWIEVEGAVLDALGALDVTQQFDVVARDCGAQNSLDALFGQPQPATPTNLALAEAFLDGRTIGTCAGFGSRVATVLSTPAYSGSRLRVYAPGMPTGQGIEAPSVFLNQIIGANPNNAPIDVVLVGYPTQESLQNAQDIADDNGPGTMTVQ